MIAVIPFSQDLAVGRDWVLRFHEIRLGEATILARLVNEAREMDADRVVVAVPRGWEWPRDLAPALKVDWMEHEEASVLPLIAAAAEEEELAILMPETALLSEAHSGRLADLVRRGIDGAVGVTSEPITTGAGVAVHDFTGAITHVNSVDSGYRTVGRMALSVRGTGLLVDAANARLSLPKFEDIVAHLVTVEADLKAVSVHTRPYGFGLLEQETLRDARWHNWESNEPQ